MEADHTYLFQAYKIEKNLDKRKRILAVSTHKNKHMTVAEIAGILSCSQQSVTNWIRRFEEEDLAGLDDRPRTDRRPKVSLVKISKIISRTDYKTTPRKLREDIRKMLAQETTLRLSEEYCTNLACQPRRHSESIQARLTSKRYADGSATQKNSFHA